MEGFTLSVWLMMGWRFEETQIKGLSQEQCSRQEAKMLLGTPRDPDLIRTQCIAPQICAFAACWPARGRV
jgi:hypothetical protein